MSNGQQSRLRMKEDIAQLEYVNAQEDAKALYVSNIDTIQMRKDMELKDALVKYEKEVAKANSKFEQTKQTYDNQQAKSLAKCKRDYDTKIHMIGLKKKSIEDKLAVMQNQLA